MPWFIFCSLSLSRRRNKPENWRKLKHWWNNKSSKNSNNNSNNKRRRPPPRLHPPLRPCPPAIRPIQTTAAGHGATSKADNMRRTTSILNPEDHDDSEEGNHKSESKTNSQNELMRLLAEKRETDKQHKEDEERALNNPTQRAEREAADLAEFNVSDDYCLAGTTVCQGTTTICQGTTFCQRTTFVGDFCRGCT